MKSIMCASCLEPFEPSRSSQKYCSDKCRQAGYRARKRMNSLVTLYVICGHCGKRFKQKRQGRKAKYCSHSCREMAYRASKKEMTGD